MAQDRLMTAEETREIIQRYLDSPHQDVSMMAPDVVFRDMGTGQEYRTPERVLALLDYFYREAFEATAELRNLLVGEGVAVVEVDFVGRHVSEFAGVPGTGKDVRVPLVVVYDVRDGMIVEGRFYFQVPAFLAQVGSPA